MDSPPEVVVEPARWALADSLGSPEMAQSCWWPQVYILEVGLLRVWVGWERVRRRELASESKKVGGFTLLPLVK